VQIFADSCAGGRPAAKMLAREAACLIDKQL
jgi:hypothetical protein